MPHLRLVSLIVLGVAAAAQSQHRDFVPVTTQMLRQPSPNDWLMYSRTYDAQRFSPLEQIDTSNVHRLGLVWTRGTGPGNTETIPLVYDGVMYVDSMNADGTRTTYEFDSQHHRAVHEDPLVGLIADVCFVAERVGR